MTIQIQGISLTSIGQLRQYLEGFLWGDNYEPIRFRKNHIRQMLEVIRNAEGDMTVQGKAIEYAVLHCPTCANNKDKTAGCNVCQVLNMAHPGYER